MTKYRWMLAPADAGLAGQIARETGVSLLLAQTLINRDFVEPEVARSFLNPRLRELSDPSCCPTWGVPSIGFSPPGVPGRRW